MKKWKRQLAWLMIVSMLAGSCITSYAAPTDSSAAQTDAALETAASSSDAVKHF